LLQERHESLTTLLRLLSVLGWVAVCIMLITSLYSSLKIPGAMIGLSLLAGGSLLSIRNNRKRNQREQPS
ncbi:MAG: hypothetical protein M3P92_11425, partial [Actinomycetota bacterium]|nr:hypothetical protein [Actinomycetota bacterium]